MDPPESGESLVESETKLNGIEKSDRKPSKENIPKKNMSPLITEIQKVINNHRLPIPGNSYPLENSTAVNAAQNNSGDSLASMGTHSVGFTKYAAIQQGAQKYTSDSFLVMLSGIYAKLLIVMGICFPIAEVISKRIPVSYYEGFYLYLYGGSISFLLFMYCFILHSEKCCDGCSIRSLFCFRAKAVSSNSISQSAEENGSNPNSLKSLNQTSKLNKIPENKENRHFYLRLGAVAFGIASMIYSGLEFGQFFELRPGTSCYNVLYGISPIARMAFTFIQMYFIFLNSQVCIKKYKVMARFGLMHMVATNLCIWLHVLVQETKHGILTLINVNFTLPLSFSVPLNIVAEVANDENFTDFLIDEPSNFSRVDRSIHDDLSSVIFECRRSNIMGELVQEASHFLFPCTIQYSLICSAILYIMWKNIGKQTPVKFTASNNSTYSLLQRQYYQVNCTKSNKGLFSGILVLVLSIISIILFFVFINKPEYKMLAIMEARVTELGLYLLTSVAVIIALFQIRELKYNSLLDAELDHILLIVAQSGLYLFTMFSIIGSHFTTDQNTLLVLVTSLACIIQATLQTIFILDAFHCYANTVDQIRRKPGRELVTFLLVCNFAMWIMNTLQTQRSDSNPIQLQFYGFWVWTIITHITTPLAIYFRFHSTVCLCAIWKRTYKIKLDFV